MKRRNFLGFLGGAAVAGPGMAKAAAAKVVEDLALGSGANVLGGGYGGGLAPMPGQMMPSASMGAIDQIVRAKNMLSKIAGLSATERAKLKRGMYVSTLDPDLASYRSLSIGTRIDMQRERNVERSIAERRTMWEIFADGKDPYEEQF